MKPTRLAVAIMAGTLALATAACGNSTDGSSSPTTVQAVNAQGTTTVVAAPTVNPLPPITLKVTGKCSDPGGLRMDASGLTPNGKYQTIASYPDGRPYNYLVNGGIGLASSDGKMPNWRWDCQNGPGGKPDPAGHYRARIIDLTTAREATVEFDVKY